VDVKYPRYALQPHVSGNGCNVLMYVNEEDDGHRGKGYQTIATCPGKMDAEDVMAAMEYRFPHGTLNRREVPLEKAKQTIGDAMKEMCTCGHMRGHHHTLDDNCLIDNCECDGFTSNS